MIFLIIVFFKSFFRLRLLFILSLIKAINFYIVPIIAVNKISIDKTVSKTAFFKSF